MQIASEKILYGQHHQAHLRELEKISILNKRPQTNENVETNSKPGAGFSYNLHRDWFCTFSSEQFCFSVEMDLFP